MFYDVPATEAFTAALRVAASQGVVTLSDRESGLISVNIGASKQQ